MEIEYGDMEVRMEHQAGPDGVEEVQISAETKGCPDTQVSLILALSDASDFAYKLLDWLEAHQ